ncbi:MAG TPA: HD domain-containing phosphohydrolase [Chthonomonadaceae bacterium]|nr:HD domain-containing phosphohydrolase [Chthonomonadaceae bacterium]
MKRTKPDSKPQREILARIMECAGDAIFSVDHGLITTWNQAAERLYGHSAQEAVGQKFLSFLWSPETLETATLQFEQLPEEESGLEVDALHVRKDGAPLPLGLTLAPLTNAQGEPQGAVIVARVRAEIQAPQEIWEDLTQLQEFARQATWQNEEREQLRRRLDTLEVVDSQTGLTNRRSLDIYLEKECQRASRYAMPLSLLLMYVDDFRSIKEIQGDHVGEAILRSVAQLLQDEARTTDLVACYEEELFGIVLPHTDRAGAVIAAERLRERIASTHHQEHPITVSVGAATFSHSMGSGKELLAEAEKALCATKLDGNNRVLHYQATQDFALFHAVRTPHDPTPDALTDAAAVLVVDPASLPCSRNDLVNAFDTAIESWSRVLDTRDREAEGHSQRIMEMALCLAQLLGVTGQDLIYLRWGALLHDIGHIGVPDHILLKPGPLTSEEWTIMRSHTTMAYEMLASIALMHPALDVPFSHHERWDGTGYPLGLAGEDIPLVARIFSIVDVWDALRSDRPHRKAWPVREALDYIYSLSGKHFDPKIVQAFHQMMQANHIETRTDALFETPSA